MQIVLTLVFERAILSVLTIERSQIPAYECRRQIVDPILLTGWSVKWVKSSLYESAEITFKFLFVGIFLL